MEINEIIRLMQAVTENGLTGFKLEQGDVKLSIRREKEVITVSGNAAVSKDSAEESFSRFLPCSLENVEEGTASGEPALTGKMVVSPLVGTFYNAASPESAPFVQVGDSVKKGQTLAIVEAMKLMNEIECEYDGIVEAVLVNNEDVVEYGQPLFCIR